MICSGFELFRLSDSKVKCHQHQTAQHLNHLPVPSTHCISSAPGLRIPRGSNPSSHIARHCALDSSTSPCADRCLIACQQNCRKVNAALLIESCGMASTANDTWVCNRQQKMISIISIWMVLQCHKGTRHLHDGKKK